VLLPEGEAEQVDMEVNGVAGQLALGPTPVTVFDDDVKQQKQKGQNAKALTALRTPRPLIR
jgi:hypothetical protein